MLAVPLIGFNQFVGGQLRVAGGRAPKGGTRRMQGRAAQRSRHQSSGVAGTLTNNKKASEEVIMPIDSILFSVAVIALLAFMAVLLLADFHQSRSP